MTTVKCKYSVIVPCYQDEASIENTYRELKGTMTALGAPYELIFVDDGSMDGTYGVIKRLQETEGSHLVAVQFLRNFGQHAAICAGFACAEGDVVITIDSDLDVPADEIPKLLAAVEHGADVAMGWRQRRAESWIRSVSSKAANWLVGRATGVKVHDAGCMLRAYRREVVQLINQFPELSKNLIALVPWLRVRVAEVRVECGKSTWKKSSRYSMYKLFQLGMDVVTGYTAIPVQIVSMLGILSSTFGFLAGIFLVAYRILYGVGPSGSVTFLALLSLFGGVQLLALGVMGEYISRIYVQVRQRPFYIVRESAPKDRLAKGY